METVTSVAPSQKCPACKTDLECELCHDFSECREWLSRPYLSHAAWFEALQGSECLRCRAIFKALTAINSEGLKAREPSARFWFESNRTGCLSIWETLDRTVSLAFNIQLLARRPIIGNDEAFHDIAPYPGHEAMWTFLKECLSCCLRTHKLCAIGQDLTWLPKRLLLLERSDTGQQVKLIDARGHIQPKQYIALSHCWGLFPGLRTTKQTLATCREGLNLHDLPATYRDCVTVATQLNISYIWIDALCIVQDDENDWAQQSQEMDLVYENALLMVAACTSPNSVTPFLGRDAPSKRLHSATFVVSGDGDYHDNTDIRARDINLISEVQDPAGPLEGRGWAWQERKLSIRQVNFLETQLVWTCREARFHEHGMVHDGHQITCSDDNGRIGRERRREITFDEWRNLVRDYAPRTLTYASDRLPAISGMASRFHAVLQGSYLAGLWAEDFPVCLGWYIDSRYPSLAQSCKPALDNLVPTWSWASISGAILWHVLSLEDVDSHSTLLRAVCQPSTANPFGGVQQGSYLEVYGRCIEARMECDGYGHGMVSRKSLAPQNAIPDCLLSCQTAGMSVRLSRAKSRVPNPADRIAGEVTCFLLCRMYDGACVLILSNVPGQESVFERVAIGLPTIFRFDDHYRRSMEKWAGGSLPGEWEDWEKWFADAETRTIRVI